MIYDENVACNPPVFALQEATLQTMTATTTEIQHKRGLLPMVSEFQCVQQWPSEPPLAQALSVPSRGAARECNNGRSTEAPEVFVSETLKIGHPTRLQSLFPDKMREMVKHCMSHSYATQAIERTEELRRWTHVVQESAPVEDILKPCMSSRRQEILEGETFTLFKTLIADAGHDDVNVADRFGSGFGKLLRVKPRNEVATVDS